MDYNIVDMGRKSGLWFQTKCLKIKPHILHSLLKHGEAMVWYGMVWELCKRISKLFIVV